MIGSVFASLYASGLDGCRAAFPTDRPRDSIGQALGIAQQLGGAPGEAIRALAASAFYDGLQAGCLVAAGSVWSVRCPCWRCFRSRPEEEDAASGEGATGVDVAATPSTA